jgi:hypothetical protein
LDRRPPSCMFLIRVVDLLAFAILWRFDRRFAFACFAQRPSPLAFGSKSCYNHQRAIYHRWNLAWYPRACKGFCVFGF